MLNLKIQNDQKIQLTLAPVTASGKPAALDGKPTWEVTVGDSTLEVADDGLSAFLVSSDKPGVSNFTVSADADLGTGVETIADSIELIVEGAKAVSLGLVAGTPVQK